MKKKISKKTCFTFLQEQTNCFQRRQILTVLFALKKIFFRNQITKKDGLNILFSVSVRKTNLCICCISRKKFCLVGGFDRIG